jgi:hypothetical protein
VEFKQNVAIVPHVSKVGKFFEKIFSKKSPPPEEEDEEFKDTLFDFFC